MQVPARFLTLLTVVLCGFPLRLFAQWEQVTSRFFHPQCFTMQGTSVYVGGSGIMRSSDGGLHWTALGSPSDVTMGLLALPTDSGGTVLYAGTSSGLYRSEKDGTDWRKCLDTLTWVNSLVTAGPYLFASGGAGIFRSDDGGGHWASVCSGLPSPLWNAHLRAVAVEDTIQRISLFAGIDWGQDGSPERLYRSTDYGLSWTRADHGLPDGPFLGITGPVATSRGSGMIAGRLFAGVTRKLGRGMSVLYSSTDDGESWASVDSNLGRISSLSCFSLPYAAGQNILVVGTEQSGVFSSTDEGAHWAMLNDGLYTLSDEFTEPPIYEIALGPEISGEHYLYAATGNTGVLRRALAKTASTAVGDKVPGIVPRDFLLEQNYPNPFNPVTTIGYRLPSRSQVRLTVYNSLGQQVKELVRGEQEAGSHEVEFNASNLASGIYFYRLEAGRFVQTRQLAVIR